MFSKFILTQANSLCCVTIYSVTESCVCRILHNVSESRSKHPRTHWFQEFVWVLSHFYQESFKNIIWFHILMMFRCVIFREIIGIIIWSLVPIYGKVLFSRTQWILIPLDLLRFCFIKSMTKDDAVELSVFYWCRLWFIS